LEWTMLVYFTAIWSNIKPFGIFYSHLVYFTAIWYILQPFGIFYSHLVYFVAIWYSYFMAIGYIFPCCTKINLSALRSAVY
jgi:hypothetical protein